MSTRLVQACIVLPGLAYIIACVDPKTQFDDYVDDVDHSLPGVPCEAQLADITGQFYLAIEPAGASPGNVITFIADVAVTDSGISTSVNLMIQPLDSDTREPIADFIPISFPGLTIDPVTAEFVIPLASNVIPAQANPAATEDVAITSGQINAIVHSADHFFGTVEGRTNAGSLDGSTFGAIRIPEGTVGSALPAPVGTCNQ